MSKPNPDQLNHSTAHLLAAAVMQLWPNTKRAIGPAIKDGFYYDFDFGNQKISAADFFKITKKMHQLIQDWDKFEKKLLTAKQAKKQYPGNKYKHELIDEFSHSGKNKISFYKSGNYTDLCKGGHVDNPKQALKHFKLLSVAGAYWRGDEKNPMLTRIYGTSWPTKEGLKKHLWQLEEAKKRDHRKLGQKLELFTISENVGPGLALWLPKGNIIKEQLENWAKEVENKWGYQRVTTPNIGKTNLYLTSGHLPYYKDDMYPSMKLKDSQEYLLKPMNCPHHHQIYATKPRSYKDLPLRLAEFGTCYRYESSGELFGLMRVRGFTQNDAHIYCAIDQAVDEFVSVMKLHQYLYKTLGITDYHLELALRDPKNKSKYHGDDKMWALAEKLMRQAVKKVNIKMVEDKGSAAFYGPKIDFIVHSSIGREFAISTNQIDLFMGQRFKLTYVDKNGKNKTPAIIHRAPLGSHERFIGFLIEHYAGAFPIWLAPVQAVIIPISQDHQAHAKKIANLLAAQNIRVENWQQAQSMQKRIREAENLKIPYMLIVGDKEIKSNSVSVRLRGKKDLGVISTDKFISKISQEINKKII